MCELELTIHSVKFAAPSECQLQVVIKRGKSKKESSQILPCSPELDTVYFDSSFHFKLSMYRKGGKYLPKGVSIRLVQISHGKSLKNGKAKVDLSGVLNSPRVIVREDYPLKRATDKTASIRISAIIARPIHSSSITSESTALSCEKGFKAKSEEEPEEFSIRPIGSAVLRHKSPDKSEEQNKSARQNYGHESMAEDKFNFIGYSPIVEERGEDLWNIRNNTIIRRRGTLENPTRRSEEPSNVIPEIRLPPTNISHVQPNVQSKGELIKQKELDAGLGPPSRKNGACNACLVF